MNYDNNKMYNFTHHLMQLQFSFKRICQDYMETINSLNINTLAADFCKKALFELGPEWEKVSSDGPDRYWTYTFEFYDPHMHCLINKKLYVGTFKKRFTRYIPKFTDYEMIISVQDACLLALDTYCKLLDVNENLAMTPSMSAVFDPERIPDLACLYNVPKKEILKKLACSVHPNGHCLPQSDGSLAIFWALATTVHSSEKQLRKNFVIKVVKKYCEQAKTISVNLVEKITQLSKVPPNYFRFRVLNYPEASLYEDCDLVNDGTQESITYINLLRHFNIGAQFLFDDL